MQDVWNHINKARIIIADLTTRNPNVFYEVGIAHALGKDVILLTQNLSRIRIAISGLCNKGAIS
jgi:nucleoside 2-deoxyribosyltransferase